jgi:hypothetical protein
MDGSGYHRASSGQTLSLYSPAAQINAPGAELRGADQILG